MSRYFKLATIALATLASVIVVIAAKQPAGPAEQQYFDCGSAGNACEVGGRRYNIAAPIGEGPFPVVLFFHGSRQSGDKTMRRKRLVDAFIRRGYAFVAPTALDINYVKGLGTGWVNEGVRGDRDDHQFVINMLDDLKQRFPVDDQRLLVTGSSNGAIFSWHLACVNIDDRLKFFAPHAGTPQIFRSGNWSCDGSNLDFYMLHAHGKKDHVIPPEGKPRMNGSVGYQGVEASISELAVLAECGRVKQSKIASYEAQIWFDCPRGGEYGFALHEGGHGIPP